MINRTAIPLAKEIRVYGFPKPQPRPKAFARNFGGKWVARVYETGTAEHWKSEIATACKRLIPSQPSESHLFVSLLYYLPRPRGHFGAKGLKASAPIYPTGKPDLDNLDKCVLDTLTKLGFWRDDSQIVSLLSWKMYADERELPGVKIKIQEGV